MRTIVLAAVAVLAGGCVVQCPKPTPYYGETEPMAVVVSAINDNNSKIKTVWGTHSFEATLVDDKNKSHSFSGSGYLLFMKPNNLLLTADGIIKFFEIGCNDHQYWFTAYPDEVSTQWWGDKDKLTEAGAKQIPIRPDLLLEVMGVSTVEDNLMQPPVPVMRFNNDADAYMFVWSRPLPDRWAPVKEVWYDRKTKMPKLVLLFDVNGRIILRAYLSDPKPIEGTTASMPWKFDLFFPENKSQMTFTMTDVKASKTKGRATIPNPGTFTFPADPGVKKQIEIQ